MKSSAYTTAFIILFALLSCAIPVQMVCAEESFDHGRFGLAASIQSNQLDISIPLWLSERFVISPVVSAAYIADGLSYSDFGVGALFRYNMRTGRAVPYIGARAGVVILIPDEGDSMLDIVLGPAFGGEYFFSPHFSIGVEGQVNVAISNDASSRFGNPGGTSINTATAVFATFYF